MSGIGTQVHAKAKQAKHKSAPCPWLCNPVPINVPSPGQAQAVIHPRKDVFVLKRRRRVEIVVGKKFAWKAHTYAQRSYVNGSYVAKIGPNGDRRCKMELELVTPKGPEKSVPSRLDTREVQCEPDPDPCCYSRPKKKKQG